MSISHLLFPCRSSCSTTGLRLSGLVAHLWIRIYALHIVVTQVSCVTMVLWVVLIFSNWFFSLAGESSIYSFVHGCALQSLFGARMMATLTWIHGETVAAEVVVAGHHLSASSSQLMRRWLPDIIITSAICLHRGLPSWRNIINLTIFFNLCQNTLTTLWRDQT